MALAPDLNEIWLRIVESRTEISTTAIIDIAKREFDVEMTEADSYHAYHSYGSDLPTLEGYYRAKADGTGDEVVYTWELEG